MNRLEKLEFDYLLFYLEERSLIYKSLRHAKYMEMVASAKKIDPQKLPPTARVAHYHTWCALAGYSLDGTCCQCQLSQIIAVGVDHHFCVSRVFKIKRRVGKKYRVPTRACCIE